MHHGLVSNRVLIGITAEVKHNDLDHVSIARRCGQVNRLGAHMTISMLSHLDLGCLIVDEFVSHCVQNEVCFFKANELE